MADSQAQLPETLPHPVDDAQTSHLAGSTLPSDLALRSTSGTLVKLGSLAGLTIVFCYSRTSAPSEKISYEWNKNPGARGCTAQASAYRDHFASLRALSVDAIYGLSTQDAAFQSEAKDRLKLPTTC